MKSTYQQLRNVLDAVYYPVDPQHEAAFKAMLLDDRKRRRKNLFWFSLSCMGILITGLGLISIVGVRPAPEKNQQEEKARTPAEQEAAVLIQGADQHPTSASFVPGSAGQNEDMIGSSEAQVQTPVQTQIETGDMHATTLTQRSGARDQNVPMGKQQKQSELNTAGVDQHTQASDQSTKISFSQTGQTDMVVNDMQIKGSKDQESKDRSQEHSETHTQVEMQAQKTEAAQSIIHYISEQKHTTLTAINYEGRKVKVECPIIPAGRILPKNRIHFGVTGAVFPAGQLLTKNHIGTGYGFQVGAYASYRMSPRIQVRADGGFSKIDGGFSYIKQSTSQQFGFSVLNQANTLEMERLYAGYAGAEIGLRRGKNVFFVGLLGQFLYGAKGDIQTLSYSLDAQAPTIISSEDVWLSTRDMNTLSLHSSIGVRSRITRRAELGVLLRIPISHTLRTPDQTDAYTYQVISHGVTPQILLSYQINQQ